MKKKALVILSGGMDSTVLAYLTAATHDLVGVVTVDYGQRHKKEIQMARLTANTLRVPHYIADMTGLRSLLSGSSLTSSDVAVPHGHYAEESMKATVVPNRNMILMSVAVGVAISKGANVVAYGAHAGDHAVYPDCRSAFTDALKATVALCDYPERVPTVEAPFIHMTKADIVTLGHSLCVPFEDTWTCYEGGELACGCCGTCVERLEAFEIAKVSDPLVYGDREFWKTAVKA